MPKKCATCETVKDFSHFEKEGKKWAKDCNECVTAEKLHLNPTPDIGKIPDFDEERSERQRQYKNSMTAMRKPE